MNPLPIIRDAFYFFTRNLGAITRICLPLIMLESLAQTVLFCVSTSDHSPIYSMLITMAMYPLYTGALIIYMAARSSGDTPPLANVLPLTLRIWPRFAVLTALTNLLFLLGAKLMLLPGIYVLVKLAFAEYLLVVRSASPLAAMRDSFNMTNGHFLRVLLCTMLVVVPLWVLQAVSFGVAGEEEVQMSEALVVFLIQTGTSFVALFSSVVGFRLFMVIADETAHG
ncbi:YciC family protein [Pseudomonas turukhanskensis]|uniref:Membrane protein n=1 Tax=Pseudomonas turukhanskensis TaxID=1806536 RepID=A0A9W6KA24_9PSED|nr:YciC family protein [Pseudomonas turukhanskensis]GLK92236.1 membrane protein [Pseudomonas turukhanskensis]